MLVSEFVSDSFRASRRRLYWPPLTAETIASFMRSPVNLLRMFWYMSAASVFGIWVLCAKETRKVRVGGTQAGVVMPHARFAFCFRVFSMGLEKLKM